MSVRRLILVVLWLMAGHAVLGGVYWMLLNVPESNAIMLIVSLLLALVLAIGAGAIETTGLLWLRPDWTWRRALARSVRVLPAFLIAAAVWLFVWWLSHRLGRYHEAHSGELDAWLIARADWTRTAWLHRTIDALLCILRMVIGTSLAVTFLAMAAAGRGVDILRLRWIPRGLAPLQLLLTAVVVYGLIWLPWQAVYWRPASLPASAAEVAFAIVKLTLIALVMHVGLALTYWIPQHMATRRGAQPATAAAPAPVPDAPAL